jgi:hypothetical protein
MKNFLCRNNEMTVPVLQESLNVTILIKKNWIWYNLLRFYLDPGLDPQSS